GSPGQLLRGAAVKGLQAGVGDKAATVGEITPELLGRRNVHCTVVDEISTVNYRSGIVESHSAIHRGRAGDSASAPGRLALTATAGKNQVVVVNLAHPQKGCLGTGAIVGKCTRCSRNQTRVAAGIDGAG